MNTQDFSVDRLIEFATNHWILFSVLAVVTYLLIQDIFETSIRKYKTTSAVGAVGLINETETAIVDVREPHEYAKAHIENSLNIPINKFDKRLEELEKYRDKTLIITCQTGTRSPQACKKLTKAGFENVYTLSGGMQGWQDLNLPIRHKKAKQHA